MPTFKQQIKSKTNGFNAAYFALILILNHYVVPVPTDIAVAGAVIANFILRQITKGPLSEK